MRIGKRFVGGLILLTALVLAAAGCEMVDHPRSTINPVSDFGWALQNVYKQVFWWTMGIFIVVEALLVVAIFRFRARGETHETPEQVHGHTRLEVAWTIVPAVILIFIAVPTIRTIFAVAAPAPPDAVRVKVTGQQWFWHFEYPELGIRTANELHVPVGRTVAIDLHAGDIIHAFWIPRVGGKRDLMPGRVNKMWFKVDKPGLYHGQCAEFCGTAHALMRFDVVAEDPASFDRWAAAQKAVPAPPTDPKAKAGATAFLTAGCIACHRIAGTAAQSLIGPDLTHVASRARIVSGLLDNTPENMARWIHDPQSVKADAKMPNLKLKPDQVDLLVAYLQSLQ
jgi:cytochrome c oxidase subunit 2